MGIIVKPVGLKFYDAGMGMIINNCFTFVGRIVVIYGEAVGEASIVVKHERQHLLLVPADGIVMDDRSVNAMKPFVKAQFKQQHSIPCQSQ